MCSSIQSFSIQGLVESAAKKAVENYQYFGEDIPFNPDWNKHRPYFMMMFYRKVLCHGYSQGVLSEEMLAQLVDKAFMDPELLQMVFAFWEEKDFVTFAYNDSPVFQ